MPDDHYQSEKLITKSLLSYKGLIPSINFKDYDYSLYLQYASPEELEQDIVKEATYLKMVYGGSTSYSLDYFPVIYDNVLELCEELEEL